MSVQIGNMRILQLVTKRQHRGAELSAFNLSRKLQERGHEIIWMGLYPIHDDVLEMPGAINIDLPGDKKSFLSIQKMKALRECLKKYEIDVIQCNGAETLKYVVAAQQGIKKRPIVYRNISQVSFWMKNSILKKKLNGFLFSHVAQVVSVGQKSMDDVVEIFPFLKDKTCVISRGVPTKSVDKQLARKNIHQELSIPEHQQVLLWVGALSPEKNPLFLIDVMEELIKIQSDVVLLMAGKGTMMDGIRNAIETKGMQSHIKLLGYRKDLPTLNAAADVAVLVSKIEGVPGVLLEAAVQSTPCVAVNVGGVSEVVEDGITGKVILTHDAQAMAKAIAHYLSDEQSKINAGNAARDFVCKQYDEEVNTSKFEKLYASLIR